MALATEFLTLLLGATLVLSACGAQQVGAAAIVNGTAISDKDVQSVALQLNTLAQGQAKLTSSTVLLSLIVAPYVLAEAKRTGKSVSDSQVLKVIAGVPEPSQSTMDFVRMQLSLQSLSQASKFSILTKLTMAKISVNPRYGTFDAKQIALQPISPDWIKASAASAVK
jgi:parvulin-like peptidyl-prolyl isomerase